VQELSKFQAIAGIAELLIYNERLKIHLVLALVAEHSFWFSGRDMEEQFSHAANSLKSQKHISITTMIEEVETAFNKTSEKQNSAWLIQWVIDNKLVCNLFCTLDTLIRSTNKPSISKGKT
jgi:hypothetical protein